VSTPKITLEVTVKRLIALILIITAGAAVAMTAAEAGQTAIDNLLDGDTTGRRVFVVPEAYDGGTIEFWNMELTLPAEPGHFVFIDDVPAANWEHEARAVYVADDGSLTVWRVTTPPRDDTALRFEELTDSALWAAVDGVIEYPDHEAIRETARRLEGLVPQTGDRSGENWALLMSGGASQSSNYPRYWNDMSFIYTTLIEVYGYDENKIIVLMSDGDNPAGDQSTGASSDLDLDQDGDDDYSLACTHANVIAQMDWLAANLDASDNLFIFTTDHGGSSGGYNTYLNLWNYQELDDDEFADELDDIPFTQCIVTMEQCFSGGFVDDVDGIPNVVISTAAAYDEYSWAMPPDYKYDEYVYHWTSSVAWNEPGDNPWELDGDAVDADTNDDGIVSALEAFTYAEANDTAGETPQYNDYSGIGSEISLWGPAGLAVIDYEVTANDGDESVPPGGTAEIDITIENRGDTAAHSVVAQLSCSDSDISVTQGTINFGTIAAGATADSPYPFEVSVSSGADNPGFYTTDSLVTSTEYNDAAKALTVMVGEFVDDFQDDVEGGDLGWTTEMSSGSQWHIEDYRSHSPDNSWKCGGPNQGYYANNSEDAILSPLVIVNPSDPQFTFWSWHDIQLNDELVIQWGNEYDGWNEIVTFSDSEVDWTEYNYDLTAYAGAIGRIRMELVSNAGNTAEGFYIDDIQVGTPSIDVNLTSFELDSRDEGVLLAWRTDNPTEIIGFDIYRERVSGGRLVDDGHNALEPLNDRMLTREVDRWLDTSVESGAHYNYYIGVTETSGAKRLFGPVGIHHETDVAAVNRLAAPYPCPARGPVTVEFELAEDGPATLAVYDLAGRRVALPLEGELSAGRHSVDWAAEVASGVYLLRLETADGVLTRRLVIER
jgi:hypothetical protein